MWLKEGNRITRFFHAKATALQRRNRITQLKDAYGMRHTWETGLSQVISDYFTTLYSSQDCTPVNILNCVPHCLSAKDHLLLDAPFTQEDVRQAVFSMSGDKSHGLDGLNPGFYQRYWDVIGDDVSAFCLQCASTGLIPPSLPETILVLIPKKQHPEYISDFRPIALCQVLYKIVAKLLAHILKCVLPKIISPTQSAFVTGRHIQDNSVVAYEAIHYLWARRRGKTGYAVLKLDICKAYDRLDWGFLQAVMRKMGFNDRWLGLTAQCVTFVSYRVLQQGTFIGPIFPSRGLRQGDPLSPYLFIICAEALSRLIQARVAQGAIHGVKIVTCTPVISHLLFADDSVLFFRAQIHEAQAIQTLLQDYEQASGQSVNFSKSLISFSPNTDLATKLVICSLLLLQEYDDLGSYLGLPMAIGRNKRERLMCRFWWGTATNRKSIHWMSWDRLCRSREDGGLAFKRLREFNLALLGKLVARLLKARYFAHCSFLDAPLGANPSYLWRSIRASQPLLLHIWTNPWLKDVTNPFVSTPFDACSDVLLVQDLMLHGRWNVGLITAVFNERDRGLILGLPLSRAAEDDLFWLYEDNGFFSVKSAYKALTSLRIEAPPAGMASESLLHLLVTCSFTRQVWTARNNLIWNHRVTAPLSVWTRALRSYHDWLRAQVEDTPPRPAEGATIWQPSALAWVKLNVDAATIVDGSCTGYGCIARDSSDFVLRVWIGRLEGAFRPKIAEALAIKEALSWIACTGWSRVIVESDCLLVVHALLARHFVDATASGDLISHSRVIVSQLDCDVVFNHVRRSANQVARGLAQASRTTTNVGEWSCHYPPFVLPILSLDS
ncbi:hypothetical protein K2173_016276 [Erythroxylum novogranatense]|uniref:Reverse transcriptase domain-containing protein n=1 Tax=Erythroxylum novogranatense TaxID=1862640 RepID=A0AAV8SGM9_9ROSI|nr:hypothetical protein K2173_016276 [Erythroxylum novogranatense]